MYHSALQWKIYRTHTKISPHVTGALSGFFSLKVDYRKSKIHNFVRNFVNQSPTRELFIFSRTFLLSISINVSRKKYSQPLFFIYPGTVHNLYHGLY